LYVSTPSLANSSYNSSCDLYNLLRNFFFVLYADGIFCWMTGRLKAVEKLSRKRVNLNINNCHFEQRKMRDLQIYF
jgi:hypothetical protein